MQPGGYRIKIVGQAQDTNLQASPTIFAKYGTWEQAVQAANPDAQTPLPNALGVRPAPGVTPQQVVTRINAVDDALEALTRGEAATKAPGVAQVGRSFVVIFFLYALVIPLVIGLFFLIVTLQKARSLTVHGDWTFADTVTVVGDAVLPDEGEPRTVDAEVIGQQ